MATATWVPVITLRGRDSRQADVQKAPPGPGSSKENSLFQVIGEGHPEKVTLECK